MCHCSWMKSSRNWRARKEKAILQREATVRAFAGRRGAATESGEMIRPFEVDGIAIDVHRNGSEAINRSAEAAAGLDVELPAMAGALEDGVAKSALRQRPERVGTLVVKCEDAIVGADDNELCASVLEWKERVGAKLRQRQPKTLHTSYASSRNLVHKGNDTKVR